MQDTGLVLAKSLFEEISNMYYSLVFLCTYLLFMALYSQLMSKCKVCWILLVLCLSWKINSY